jgi:hypothetical protein
MASINGFMVGSCEVEDERELRRDNGCDID